MTRIEKIIVVVLCLLSLSFLGYMIAPWTSQGIPAALRRGLCSGLFLKGKNEEAAD
jgi:hypothetical protein